MHRPRILRRVVYLHAILLLVAATTRPVGAQSSLEVDRLRVEHADRPLGLHTQVPRLSWMLSSDERGQVQTAYQIVVAASDASGEEVWNSGKVVSGQSVHVPYGGPPLESRRRYSWRVRVWDGNDERSTLSHSGWWEMGLLSDDDWEATWISATTDTMPVHPAPLFRTSFEADVDVDRARLYISGLGYHEASLNGKKVGDHVLDPVATRYDRRVKYVVHDVTSMIREGENAIGVVLGTGWYNQHTESAWDFNEAPWRAAPALLAQLEITYADGRRDVVTSDTSWRASTGAITFDGIRHGEHVDARLEKLGWDAPGYDTSSWSPPVLVEGPSGTLSPQLMPPIRVTQTRYPVRVQHPTDSTVVFDFGQNLSGWVRLRVRGPAGAEVVIRYGERVFEDGSLDQTELRRFIWTGETQTDRYTLRGGLAEESHPHFVYHGFQFAEIAVAEEVELELVEAEVVHTDFERVGTFESSDPLINRIQNNLIWSYLGNFHGYPTDCPHREKIGWSGDAHLAAQAGLYNFDAVRAYLKWIDDFADEQRPNGQVPGIIPTSGWGYTFGQDERYRERGYGPSWEGAYVLIPWYLYQFSGDASILERYYDGLRAYVDYLAAHTQDHVIRFGIDDHKPAFTQTEPPIVQTGFYYECTRIVADMARILGRDATELEARLSVIRKAYQDAFINGETYGNGGQTSLAGALYHGLAVSEQYALARLMNDIEARDGHIDGGVVGTRYVLSVLDRVGADETAYRIVTQTDYPGWGHWIAQGATTLWQNWDGSQSRNHVMFGSVGDWFYSALGGIRPAEPGFKHTVIEPAVVGDLNWVRASHVSPYGEIASSWEREGDRLLLNVRIPVNTTAIVHVPGIDVLEDGQPVGASIGIRVVSAEAESTVLEVGSGTYSFTALLP